MFNLIGLAVLQSALLAIGQVLLKFGLARMLPFDWSFAFWRSVFCGGGTDGHVMRNIALIEKLKIKAEIHYIGGNGIEKDIIKKYPLSMAYPMISLSYVFGLIAAVVFFHEQVGLSKWLGTLLIITGCCIIAK